MAWGTQNAGLALLAALVAAGCYNPNILDGGFTCAEAGKQCPDGFSCDPSDNRCHRGGALLSDGGPPMCSVPKVASLCGDQPAAGQLCNPACQNGCDCGRCNVSSSGDAVCTTTGTKTVGQLCTVGNGDDCGPGLFCLQEPCGNNLGRCYRHCDNDGQCTSGFCQVPIKIAGGGTSPLYRVCDLPPQTCNPVNNTGCTGTSLNCYSKTAKDTGCDCPSGVSGGIGAMCNNYNDCMPGLICITATVGGIAGTHCQPLCNFSSPVCPSGRSCIRLTTDSMYGYCG